MRYHKFSKDHFFHGNEKIAVFLTEDSPHTYPQPYSTLNRREFWKITFILEGSGILVINGHRYNVSAGFVCLIHPQDLTTWELTDSLILYNVLFQYPIVEKEVEQWGKKNDFFAIFQTKELSNLSVKHELLHLLDTNRKIASLIRKMYQEYRRDILHSEDFLRVYLLELLLVLSRSGTKNFSKNRKMTVLDLIRRKLLADPRKMPDLSLLCEESGYSRNYLLSAYKKVFGETMGQTLLKRRIAYAIELLQKSDLSVEQICYKCSFPDISNFYRVFRRETGGSPGFFRTEKNHCRKKN